MIGATLDKYEVLQKLGEGGMATVYLGRHGTLNRDVAIKVLHPHLSSSPRNRKRFAAEARAIERLRHPNILEIFDYSGIEASDCYIVTEYVHGSTLAALLRDHGRLPPELTCLLGIDIADALSYAHHGGILHRDIKPENVMLRPDGCVKLMDFGIARFLDESHVTMTGALVGSPAFMSPEQATEGNVDQRSDIFSLGTMLFHLVTGSLPFAGSNPSVILKNVIEGRRPTVLELAPACSALLADVIERSMSPRPDDRFNSASEVRTALRAALDEIGLDASDPAWSVAAWLADPGTWDRALETRLRTTLLDLGRGQMAKGEPLAALRLLNRLLAIDEGNAEVLALVQNLHRPTKPVRKSVAVWVGGLALVLVTLGGVAWWTAGTDPLPSPTTVSATRTPASPNTVPGEPNSIAPGGEIGGLGAASLALPIEATAAVEQPVSVSTGREFRRPVPDELAVLPPQPAQPPAPARVRFVTPFSAFIYKNGRVLGDVRQRESFLLEAGHHELIARGDAVEDLPFTLDLEPASDVEWDLNLLPRPARLHLDATWPAACLVKLDGADAGLVGSLPRSADGGVILAISRPLEQHDVTVTCDGVATKRHWDRFTSVDVAYPSRP